MRLTGLAVLVVALACLPTLPVRAEVSRRALDGAAAALAVEEARAAVGPARAAAATGRIRDAIRILLPYVGAHPENIVALRFLGDLHRVDGDERQAERRWRQAAQLDAFDAPTNLRLARLHFEHQQLRAAAEEYERALELRAAYTGLVAVHRALGDTDALVARFAREAAGKDADLVLRHANLLAALGRGAEAIPIFRRVVAARPGDCIALINLSDTLTDLNAPAEALASLQQCLRVDPRSYPALVNASELYIRQRDLTLASAAVDAALAVVPNGAEALVNRGFIEDARGNLEPAMRSYEAAIAADPLTASAYVNLAYDYLQLRLFPLAEGVLRGGLAVDSHNGRLHYLMGLTYAATDRPELARREYESAAASEETTVVRAASAALGRSS